MPTQLIDNSRENILQLCAFKKRKKNHVNLIMLKIKRKLGKVQANQINTMLTLSEDKSYIRLNKKIEHLFPNQNI